MEITYSIAGIYYNGLLAASATRGEHGYIHRKGQLLAEMLVHHQYHYSKKILVVDKCTAPGIAGGDRVRKLSDFGDTAFKVSSRPAIKIDCRFWCRSIYRNVFGALLRQSIKIGVRMMSRVILFAILLLGLGLLSILPGSVSALTGSEVSTDYDCGTANHPAENPCSHWSYAEEGAIVDYNDNSGIRLQAGRWDGGLTFNGGLTISSEATLHLSESIIVEEVTVLAGIQIDADDERHYTVDMALLRGNSRLSMTSRTYSVSSKDYMRITEIWSTGSADTFDGVWIKITAEGREGPRSYPDEVITIDIFEILIPDTQKPNCEVSDVALDSEGRQFVHFTVQDTLSGLDNYVQVVNGTESHGNYWPQGAIDPYVQAFIQTDERRPVTIDLWLKDLAEQVNTCSARIPPSTVDIDIKPKTISPLLNIQNMRAISVAVLSTSYFDAPAMVEWSALRFGHTGEEDSLLRLAGMNKPACGTADTNGDGFLDLVCRFIVDEMDFQCGDAVGVMKTVLPAFDNATVYGSDAIVIAPCEE